MQWSVGRVIAYGKAYTEQYILHCTQYSYLNYELQMYRCKAVFWRIGSTVCTVYVGQNTHYVLPRGGE